MKNNVTDSLKIIDLSEYRIQKVATQLDEFYGTPKGDELEKEYRQLLREKKRKEKRNGKE